MDDVTRLEQRLSDDALRVAGPSRPVDAAAIFTAITATQSPKWRFQSMFSATKFVVAGAIVALFSGFLLTGVLTQPPSDEPLPAVAASASVTTLVEPTAEATAESEPVPEATVVPDSNLGPGTFTPTGSLDRGRSEHTATLLSDGRVLVVGGSDYSKPNRPDWVTSAEAWDPLTGSFSSAGELTEGRYAHTATLLADGRVLVAGGSDNSYGVTGLASAEIWDPATESFSPAGPLLQSRGRHSATLLADGRVLVVGGVVVENDAERFLASAEIWDPATESFSPAGSLDAARVVHTATLLPDGRVLVVGGANPDGASPASAEIWDPATESFSPAGSLLQPRGWHSATLLPDGRVLVVGGRGGDGFVPAEIWDPGTESFTSVGSLAEGRWRHAATLLADGHVLVVGGLDAALVHRTDAEIWDPAMDSVVPAPPPVEAREALSLTALPDGRALLVGGSSANGVLASAEVWEPEGWRPKTDGVSTTTTPGLLPGVDLVAEEVEPGVYRVLSDGVGHDVASAKPVWHTVSPDGDVVVFGSDGEYLDPHLTHFFTLGVEGSHEWERSDLPFAGFFDAAVEADGALWAILDAGWGAENRLGVFDGSSWTTMERPTGSGPAEVEIGPDGTVWAGRTIKNGRGPRVGRLSDGEWSRLPGSDDPALRSYYDGGPFDIGPDGTLWFANGGIGPIRHDFRGLLRFDGEDWQVMVPDVERAGAHVNEVAVGPDGTVWVHLVPAPGGVSESRLARLGATGWEVFTAQDGVPLPDGVASPDFAVDAAGTLWIAWSDFGLSLDEPDSDLVHRCPGVLSLDGSEWTRYLVGVCVNHIEVGPQGSVWGSAPFSEAPVSRADVNSEPATRPGGLYVITPEAVAGGE